MRCKNCGWPNQPGETECRKCHAPLDGGGVDETVFNAPEPPVMEQVSNLKKTVLEAAMPGMPQRPAPAAPAAPAAPVASGNTCPKCGFPLRPGSDHCPKCGYVLDAVPSQPAPRRATVLNAPAPNMGGGTDDATTVDDSGRMQGVSFKNVKGNMKTINPFLDGFDPISVCSLTPMKRSNERHPLQRMEYEGDSIVLNRANTDPENPTVASDTQAVITKVNDRYFIEDKSEAGTTFVRAGGKVEIRDGSIVLLGNRLFEFHVQ